MSKTQNTKVEFTEKAVRAYLAKNIRLYRAKAAAGNTYAVFYVDAFQATHLALFGELLPQDDQPPVDPERPYR